MAFYETVMVLRRDLSPAQAEEIAKKYQKVLETGGAKIIRTEDWGLLPLAYQIKKNKKAYYSMVVTETPAAALQECERQMGLDEDVIRFMSVRLESADKEPSVMMKAKNNKAGE